MPQDTNLRTIEIGDWVRIPDTFYPWTARGDTSYGSQCRYAHVTQVWDDGIINATLQNVIDFENVERGSFTYAINVYGDEVTVVESHGLTVTGAETYPVTFAALHPRDARGRFTRREPVITPAMVDEAQRMDVAPPIFLDDVPAHPARALDDSIARLLEFAGTLGVPVSADPISVMSDA